jgi:hypothetical protein
MGLTYQSVRLYVPEAADVSLRRIFKIRANTGG